jgi:hypothetical protein
MMRSIKRLNPLLLSGASLTTLAVAGLALHIPGSDSVGSDTRTAAFVTLLAVAAVIYLLAVRHVLRQPASPRALMIVLAIAIAMRIPALLGPPFLSSDMYRYVWDGRVQAAGINPYRYLPADPALQSLRDDTVYPLINRKATAPTIYPPAAQIVFQAVARLSDSVLAMKLAMVAFEALACFAMLRLLTLAHLPPERVLIYAWNPLAVWTFAGNGHVDAIAIGLLAVALLLRVVKRDAWLGLVFGAAVLVKFLPAAVAPALWRREAPWRMPLIAAATIAGLYLLYSSVGWQVLGFLPGYFGDEDLTQGTGIWLLAGLGHLVPPTPLLAKVYAVAALIGLGALAVWIAFRPRGTGNDVPGNNVSRNDVSGNSVPGNDVQRICGDAALLAAALTVVISPHYPWYFVWVALPCCVCARWSIIWLGVAPVLLYLDPFHERFFWPCLVYLPAAALALREWWHHAASRPLDVRAIQGSS